MIKLDPEQQAVVDFRLGSAIVATAAGAGKTTTAVERAFALEQAGVRPSQILLLTFNRHSAADLRQKLAQRKCRTQAQTFHAYAWGKNKEWYGPRPPAVIDNVKLRKIKFWLPIYKDMRLPGEWDDWPEIDEIVRESDVDVTTSDARQLVQRLLTRARVELSATKAIDALKAYEAAKIKASCVDYTDMICRFRRWLPDFVSIMGVKHIMVDESQDTSPVQRKIADLFGAQAESYLLIMDPRQSIYSFRQASVQTFLEKIDAGTRVFPIRTCRRSTPEIVEYTNGIVRSTPYHVGGDANAADTAPSGPVPVVAYGNADTLAKALATDLGCAGASSVVNGVRMFQRDPTAYAVIARTNAVVADVACALDAHGVPVRIPNVVGGAWQTPVGRMVLAYLAAADGHYDDLGLIANRPLRYVSNAILDQAIDANKHGVPLAETLGRARFGRDLYRDLQTLTAMPWVGRCSQVHAWLTEAEYDRRRIVTAADDDRIGAIAAMVSAAQALGSYAAVCARSQAALAWEQGNRPAVTVGTVHALKGLEFENVCVFGVNTGTWPSKLTDDPPEERRIFYVACSRAKRALVIMAASPEKASELTKR